MRVSANFRDTSLADYSSLCWHYTRSLFGQTLGRLQRDPRTALGGVVSILSPRRRLSDYPRKGAMPLLHGEGLSSRSCLLLVEVREVMILPVLRSARINATSLIDSRYWTSSLSRGWNRTAENRSCWFARPLRLWVPAVLATGIAVVPLHSLPR